MAERFKIKRPRFTAARVTRNLIFERKFLFFFYFFFIFGFRLV